MSKEASDPYIAWIRDALARKPHLTQSGLAKHLERDRSVISMMLAGSRQIKAHELDRIESYLGEPRPGREAMPTDAVQIVGRVSSAWYEPSEMPPLPEMTVAPVLNKLNMRQVAFVLDAPAAGLPAGAIVVATPVEARHKPTQGQLVIVRRERAGLENITLIRMDASRDLPGIVVAVAIEFRVTCP